MQQNEGTFSKWRHIQQKYENSVMQINTIHAVKSPLHPYAGASEKFSAGSSFLIDKKRGIFATNAHVLNNFISITGAMPKFGKYKIPLELVSIVRDKDIALVRIEPKVAKEILKDSNEFELGDNLTISHAEEVLAIGFPLGERTIKYTSGIISGHQSDETGFYNKFIEDTYEREPTFLTTTAPLNPGSSGSPLVNIEGKVLAINSAGRLEAQNVGYSIGIRVLLANYKNMINNQIPKLPTFNLRWSNLNEDAAKFLCKNKKIDLSNKGVLVRKILPDSVFQGIEQKDILTHIRFSMFKYFDKMDLDKMCAGKIQKMSVIAELTNLGDIALYEEKTHKRIFNRQINLSELSDMIEVDEPMEVFFLRNGEVMKLNTTFSHVESDRVHGIYDQFQEYDYSIVAGMCICELKLNQMGALRKFHLYGESNSIDDVLYSKRLIVSNIFSETEAAKFEGINVGDVLEKVNDIPVKTLDDLNKALTKAKGNYLTFETETGAYFIISAKNLKKDDKIVAQYV
jgi:S1-C subfamily serine protease